MILKYILPLIFLSIGVSCMPRSSLLGAKECTWGPAYWCKNLTSAHGCNAVPHCITTVWEHKEVEQDPDDICTICKHMVIEARDQLESNMTMDELKQVFDGSCKLMYVKPAVQICTKLADELVPELVDAISSQMNPDVVCSVAGLCNNVEIDDALKEFEGKGGKTEMPKNEGGKPDEPHTEIMDYTKQNCDVCGKFVNQTTEKISQTSTEDLLNYLLDLCGKTSSYSDSCASIILAHFDDIEANLRTKVSGAELCTLTGSCVSNRKPLIGEETCDLCKQLVLHFKDIVTADTTAEEFKKVLHGICKQTRKFSDECNQLTDEYSDEIFKIISQELDGQTICTFFNICPRPNVYINGPVDPMLPSKPVSLLEISISDSETQVRVISDAETPRPTIIYGDSISDTSSHIVLPEHLLVGKPVPPSLLNDTNVNGQQECVFCQYLLHYIQKVITQPYGEEAIKKVVDDVCDKLPKSVSLQCREFVELYGDAFVALLAQEIDPSQVCPSLKICPSKLLADRYEVLPVIGKPGCPLCLMAISALDEELANNKTEDSVKAALDKVCSKLPKPLVQQCDDLVNQYTEQLVDMILADFTPEEVCAYLKICKKPNPKELVTPSSNLVQVDSALSGTDRAEEEPYEIRTNEVEIPEETEAPEHSKVLTYDVDDNASPNLKIGPSCVICEFVMEKVDDILKENKTQANMDKVIHGVCNHLPHTVRKNCNEFVVKYAEEIINTLAMMVAPSEVCTYMGMCLKATLDALKESVNDCIMCDEVARIQHLVMRGQNIAVDRANFLMNICDGVDDNQGEECREFIQRFGVVMFNAYMTGATPNDVCKVVGVCSSSQMSKIMLTSDAKRSPTPLGANKCTHGPGYWCLSQENAAKCGAGAVKHCQEKVWPF